VCVVVVVVVVDTVAAWCPASGVDRCRHIRHCHRRRGCCRRRRRVARSGSVVCWSVISQAPRLTRRSHLPKRPRSVEFSVVATPIQWGSWVALCRKHSPARVACRVARHGQNKPGSGVLPRKLYSNFALSQ
jgi:hypothetical protein